MFLCWSAKGGSGTTVVSASLSLVLSHQRPTLLVDLAGDVPAALGLPEPAGPGLGDWLSSPTADADALLRLAVPATDTLQVLPHGSIPVGRASPRLPALVAALQHFGHAIVIDAGTGVPPAELFAAATHRLIVTRPCYLSLRRAVASGLQPTGIVLVGEPGRALQSRDVERALHAPVVAEVDYDPSVARCVDAGLLAARLPRSLSHSLTPSTKAAA